MSDDMTPIGGQVMLFTNLPYVVLAHKNFYGHEPWSDRTVAPWECRPCTENGVKNVF